MASKRKYNEEALDGRIIRIKLRNFLTYDSCEFYPGEGLNVILGPNGTGKSSIVCAICLGLGGKPTLLGRAKNEQDYIKHRTDEALIEIELLKNNGPNLIVKRIIKREVKDYSEWYLNGKHTTRTQVLEATKQMNVQMSNLCQFLPQDRVVEFAKMNPQELLEATEKAVGPPNMFENHKRLIELKTKFVAIESSKKEKELAKERIENVNKTLERDMQRHLEREKHQEEIETLEKKKPWVEYESARQKFMDDKESKSHLEKTISEERKKSAPLQKEKEKIEALIKEIDKENKKLLDESSKYTKNVENVYGKLGDKQEEIDDIKKNLQEVLDDENKRKNKLAKLQKDIESLEKDLNQAPDPAVLQPRCEELNKLNREVHNTLNEISKKIQEFQTEKSQLKVDINSVTSRIRKLENTDNQKLETLRRSDRSAFDAVEWLHSNTNKFRGTIYHPIMTQINMKDMKDAIYLESLISFNDMKAFVCQNREDQDLFSNITRDTLRINVAAVCPPRDAKQVYKPRIPIEELQKYGFRCYVSDMFTAPLTVMQYLCEKYNFHNIPVGDVEKTNQEVIDNVAGLNRFCSTESVYTISQSLYSRNKSTNLYALRKQARLLNVSVDLEEKKQLNLQLSEFQRREKEFSGLIDAENRQLRVKQKEQENIRNEKKELQSKMNQRKAIAQQIATRQKRLSDVENEAIDVEAAKKAAEKDIGKVEKARLRLTKQLKDVIEQCVKSTRAKIELALRQANQREQHEKVVEQYRESTESLRKLEESLGLVSQRLTDSRNRARNLLKKAQETIKDLPGSDGKNLPDSLKDIFETLPDTVEEIDAAINEKQAILQCQYETNPGVIKEFKKNKREITGLQNEVVDQERELDTMQKEIDELLENWLVPLEELVERINEQYRDFFQRMGCAGQVVLDKHPDNDYKKFGIQIQVKFRASEKLRVLTSYFQSGGERSVSTMLYLISLQELTKCPFRVVDEINQGMDPANERRVFELVVETVCRPNTSQYFLITPKLLPDLKYTDRMTILTVLNGKWILPHETFSIKKFIKKKEEINRREEITR